jgi:UDP-glucose 4-epimerase
MQLRNRRVVVTGGAGFIGSHVVDQLVSAGNEVLIVDDFSTGKWENIDHHGRNASVHVEQADVRDLETMLRLTQGVDVVFHMAVACLRTSLQDPMFVHEANATGTLHMCLASYEAGVERFVYVSSSEAYGSAFRVPMDEEHPLNPTTVYGASKAAGEHYTLAYWRTHGLPSIVVRPFNTYGPREPDEGKRAEVIPKFVMRTLAGHQPVIFGNGDQTRDFTWVEDSARGIIMAAECDELVGDNVNIARGQEASILSVCELVLQKLGREDLKPLYLDDGRPGDVKRHYADISKAQRLLGFSPNVDLDSGLDQYIQWIQARDPNLESWVAQDKIRNW